MKWFKPDFTDKAKDSGTPDVFKSYIKISNHYFYLLHFKASQP